MADSSSDSSKASLDFSANADSFCPYTKVHCWALQAAEHMQQCNGCMLAAGRAVTECHVNQFNHAGGMCSSKACSVSKRGVTDCHVNHSSYAGARSACSKACSNSGCLCCLHHQDNCSELSNDHPNYRLQRLSISSNKHDGHGNKAACFVAPAVYPITAQSLISLEGKLILPQECRKVAYS